MDVTSEASEALAPGEALVFDWHRVAICCAVAGEVSLRRTSMREVERAGSFVRLSSREQAPVFAHRRAYVQLADRQLTVGCRRRFGRRRGRTAAPEGAEAIDFYTSFYKEDLTPKASIGWEEPDAQEAFINGDVAMLIAGGWTYNSIIQTKPELEKKIGTALEPAGPSGKDTAFAGGSSSPGTIAGIMLVKPPNESG